MNILPLYANFFPADQVNRNLNWNDFSSSMKEIQYGPNEPDFSIDERTWTKTCLKVAFVVLKIVLFPWILFEGLRFIVNRILMTALYPAQSWIIKFCAKPKLKTGSLDQQRMEGATQLKAKNYVMRHVVLQKDGTSFSGVLVGKPETLNNGKWVLQATGNLEPIEKFLTCKENYADAYQRKKYNLLMVNGPGVGRSGGMATTDNLWEPQEIAITFLEQVIHATKIVIAGFSLGAAASGQGIVKHEFKDPKPQCLAISQMSFDSVSNVGRKMMKTKAPCLYPFSRFLSKFGRVDIDSIDSAKKMVEMGIPQAIIQAGTSFEDYHHDGIVPPKGTLGRRLHKLNIKQLKTFYFVDKGSHSLPMKQTLQAIEDWEATHGRNHLHSSMDAPRESSS